MRPKRTSVRSAGAQKRDAHREFKRVLLLVDLEGIAGVSQVGSLLFGGPGHLAACTKLTAAVQTVCSVLVQRAETVLVLDTHLSGAQRSNVDATGLPPSVSVVHSSNPFLQKWWKGVDALALLGMHAAAGEQAFAAHTVGLSARWSNTTRHLSEADLALSMAARRQIPVIFVSGDLKLRRHLQPDVVFVPKPATQRQPRGALPKPSRSFLRQLAVASQSPARGVPPQADQRIQLSFLTRALTQAAGRDQFESADAPTALAEAMKAHSKAETALESTWGEPSLFPTLLEQLDGHFAALSAAPSAIVKASVRSEAAVGALGAALKLSESDTPELMVLRALALHMLEGFAPRFFRAHQLRATKDLAFSRLLELPHQLDPELTADQAQDVSDTWYLRQFLPRPPALNRKALHQTVTTLRARGEALYAWVIASNAAMASNQKVPPPPAQQHRLPAGYALTHEVIFASRYLTLPFRPTLRQTVHAMQSVEWVVRSKHVDLAGELLWVLQLSEDDASPSAGRLLNLMRDAQRSDGAVVDKTLESSRPTRAHTSFVAALAFARSTE